MSKTRETPCLYYMCSDQCQKGRKAGHKHYCQYCDKYKPRVEVRHLNKKKQKLDKIKREERY